jgi:uncharacterized membrane protein
MGRLVSAGSEPAIVWALLLCLAALGLRAERTWLGRALSGPGVVLTGAFLLSCARILPATSTAYEAVWDFLLPLAVGLLILSVDLRGLASSWGGTLGAFAVGALATLVAALAAFFLVPVGPLGASLGGMYAATYIGGSMNFVAVAQAVRFPDAEMLAAAVAADNLVGAVYLLLIGALARLRWSNAGERACADAVNDDGQTLHANGLIVAVCIAAALVALGKGLAGALARQHLSIIFITVLALGASLLLRTRGNRVQGPYPIGMFLMYVFFAVVGARIEFGALLQKAPRVLLFAAFIVGVHLVITIAVCRLLRVPMPQILTGSVACVLGPGAAAAVTATQGWSGLTSAAVVTGTLGYAIATFLGLALIGLLEAL